MRLKQFLITLACSAAIVAPALAQPAVPTAPKAVTTAPTMPATPTMPTMPTMPSKASVMPSAASPTMATPVPATTAATGTTMAPVGAMTNINTATATDLDKLPQIGKARAKKIIDNRPYKTTDELVSKKVLSISVFNKIKDKINAS